MFHVQRKDEAKLVTYMPSAYTLKEERCVYRKVASGELVCEGGMLGIN